MLQNQVQDDGKSGEGLVHLEKLTGIYLWFLSDFERFWRKTREFILFQSYQKMSQ